MPNLNHDNVRVHEHLIICATSHIASLNYCQIQYIPYCLADEINDLSLKVKLLSKKYDTQISFYLWNNIEGVTSNDQTINRS